MKRIDNVTIFAEWPRPLTTAERFVVVACQSERKDCVFERSLASIISTSTKVVEKFYMVRHLIALRVVLTRVGVEAMAAVPVRDVTIAVPLYASWIGRVGRIEAEALIVVEVIVRNLTPGVCLWTNPTRCMMITPNLGILLEILKEGILHT